jgi:hypothetical protein
VLPGFELTTTFGFHVLAIFPEGTSIRQLEHLLLELNIPEDKIDHGSGEVGATVDVLTAYETLHESGALVIPAHVNSTHGVAMQNLPFGGQTKIAFTQSPFIAALEATDMDTTSRRSTARFFNGSKPEYPRRMHIIQGSDAHRLNRDPNRETNLGVGDRMTEVALPEVSWAALRDLFQSNDFNRIRPYRLSHDTYDFIRLARSEGETIVQTFHPTPPARRGRLSPVLRDAVAFANGNGGTIYVGLSALPREPVHGVDKAAEQARFIAEDIARHTTPPLAGSIDVHTTDGKQVIVISIPAGTEKPYAILPSTIYVRQEGETTLALRDEIVELVRAGLAQTVGLPELVPEAMTAAPQPMPFPLRAQPPAQQVQLPRTMQVAADLPAATVTPIRPAREPAREATPAQPAGPAAHPVGISESRSDRSRRHPARVEQPVAAPAVVADVVAATMPAPLPAPPAPTEIDVPEPRPAADIPPVEAIPYPRTGVEIVETVDRNGVRYHAMRDLRNLKVVHNVTRDSARRLWRYAISQDETHDVRPEDVSWQGDRGFWKSYKPRGGDIRYNLVYRHESHLHVFYGVTDEGIDESWRAVVPERLRFRPPSEPVIDVPAGEMEEAPEPVEVGGVDAEVVGEAPRFAPLVPPPAAATVHAQLPAEPDVEVEPQPAPATKPARPRRASTRARQAPPPAAADATGESESDAPASVPQPVASAQGTASEAVPARRTRSRRAPAAPATTEPDAAAEPAAPPAPVDAPPARRSRTRRAAAAAADGEPAATAEPAAEDVAPSPPKRARARRTKATDA